MHDIRNKSTPRSADETRSDLPVRETWLATGPPEATRHAFPGRPEHVGEVRALTRKLFAGTDREDDAVLVADELANNAILYTRSGLEDGWFGVEIVLGDGSARIAVTDLGGAGWIIGGSVTARGSADTVQSPWLAAIDDDLTDLDIPELKDITLGGRGLPMITDVSITTGAEGSDAFGHTVWATLALPGAGRDALDAFAGDDEAATLTA